MSLALQPTNSQAHLEWVVQHELELSLAYADKAISNARKSAHHAYSMFDACLQLQAMGVHKAMGKTWQQYFCELTGYQDASRFYQLKKVRELARIIHTETGEIATEWELRSFPLNDVNTTQKEAILALYHTAKQTALQRDNKAPDKTDYAIAQEVIIEIQATLIPAPETDTDKVVNHVIEQILHEKTLRRNDHIQHNSQWETVHKSYPSIGYRKRVQKGIVRNRRNETLLLIQRKRKTET
jgi:hypothetical protein